MPQFYRARATIVHRKPASDDDRRQVPPVNSNPATTIEPNQRFDPEAVGISKAELDGLVSRGHVVALGPEGENMDTAETARIAARYAGPAPVPTTTERDQKTGGAAPQTPGGRGGGNTSPPAGGPNRAPMEGDKPQVSVSGPATAGAPTTGNR